MNQVKHWSRCLVFFTCLVSGCWGTRYYSTPHEDVYLLADYEDTLRQWTVGDEIHSRFISIADGSVLFLSWEVRQGFINAVRERMNPDPAYLQQVIAKNIQQFENGNEFYLGMYCYEEKWTTLTGIEPVWYLTLTSDTGSPVRPLLIERVAIRPEQAWMFLNELTHGREVFRVVFPLLDSDGNVLIGKQTRSFTIKCQSLLGVLNFKWSLGPIPNDLD